VKATADSGANTCFHSWVYFDHWFNGETSSLEVFLSCRMYRGSVLTGEEILQWTGASPEAVYEAVAASDAIPPMVAAPSAI
jgi:hypothetical protein